MDKGVHAMIKLIKRLENSIIGDIIGVVCIAFIFIALPWFTVALA
jgi:hypothetical protein